MIRVLILVVMLFLVWVLFVSSFDKQKKIIISVVAVILCAIAVWFEGADTRYKDNLVTVEQVTNCGITAQSGYRSNFDFTLCFENTAAQGTVRRLSFDVIASACENSKCEEIERVRRALAIVIQPGKSATISQSLAFDQAAQSNKALEWTYEVIEVDATVSL